MSERRSLSFSENEKDLLKYFDSNGKSDIAKIALKFYIDNKDKLKPDSILNEITKLLKHSKIENNIEVQTIPVVKNNKSIKLIK